MDYSKKTIPELKALCKERNIKGITGKKKDDLIQLLTTPVQLTNEVITPPSLSPISPTTSHEKCALSLFSGAGGDTCGLEAAGWKVTHFSEFNAMAVQTHEAAFPGSKILKGEKDTIDIKKVADKTFSELKGSIDLIFAGFPCQGFSHAGKKRTDDPRNELVHEFARAVRLIQPTWFIGENVKGLLSRKGVYPPNTALRPIIEIIGELFEGIGYKISYRVIDVREVGVPQLRKRLIIIGHRGSEYPVVPWDTFLKIPPTLGIRTLLTSTLEGAVELPALYKPHEQDSRFWIPTIETVATGKPHPNLERLVGGKRNLSSKEVKEAGHAEKAKIEYIEPAGLISFGVRKSGYHGQILDPDAPSKTIICAYNQCPRLFVGLYNQTTKKYWIRCLTYEECGQIQGFPAKYPWQGAVKDKIVQIGNAVPPPLATTLAKMFEKITFSGTPQVLSTVDTSSTDSDNDDEVQ
jgi:DNA (cytosine-5)-methyltransferase 1